MLLCKKQKKNKKITNINFLNSGTYEETLSHEIKIFNILKKYCRKNNLNLTLISRAGYTPNIDEDFYRRKFGNGSWNYYESRSKKDRYDFVNNSELLVFAHTTLGLEALAKGVKCIILLSQLAKRNMHWQHNDEGYFWTTSKDFGRIKKKIDRVIKTNYEEWSKISNNVSSVYMNYDRSNQKKINHIKTELRNKS